MLGFGAYKRAYRLVTKIFRRRLVEADPQLPCGNRFLIVKATEIYRLLLIQNNLVYRICRKERKLQLRNKDMLKFLCIV